MEDPRTEHNEDNITGDEDDDLIDLQKEYDLKKALLLQKKQEKSTFLEQFNSIKPVTKIDYDKRIFQFQLPPTMVKEVDETETFSKEIIRIRNYCHQDILTITKDVKILNVTKILAKITQPDYKEPNYNNWAMVGFITEKLQVLKTVKNNKYIRLRVGTFEHTITINLFDEAYDKYWKLRIGDLIMVLNPGIHKLPKGFGFHINEALDNILVIGTIKNIAKCNEATCKTFVNPVHKYCEFHESTQESKFLKNKRMELNGSIRLFNPKQKQQQYLMELNEQSKIYHHKSNFNRDRFIDENVFNKAGSKRKLQDEATNRKLETKLSKLANTSKYQTLGLLKTSATVASHDIKREAKTSNIKNELQSLVKDKTIRLGMSKTDRIAKRQRWDQNMTILNTTQSGNTNNSRICTTSARAGDKLCDTKHVTAANSDSDDDLDIIVGKSNYQQLKHLEKYKRLNPLIPKD